MDTVMRPKIVAAVFLGVTLSLLLVFTPARSAERPGLLYATSDAGTKLVAFSLETKTTRTIGGIGYPFSLSLAFCPPGKVPYTIINLFGPSAQLATLNLGRGRATPVSSAVIQPNDMMGMTCSRDGTLYAIGQSDHTQPDYNSLYTVDRVTGQPTLIGALGVDDGSGNDFLMSLAFAPDGKLYGANAGSANNVCSIFLIDPSTGHATKVVDLQGVGSVMGLAIDSDGNFYVADFVSGSRIYAVDTTTGVATPIMNTGKDFVHNIAFRTPG
jgi:DNA-binding beta-propeller fold protein YncE